MQNQRRKFITAAGLVIGGTAAGGIQLLASESGSPEREVLNVVARYGASSNTVRGTDNSVEYTVKMKSFDAFTEVFGSENGPPFEGIHAGEGNTLSFKHQGVQFTLRNVA